MSPCVHFPEIKHPKLSIIRKLLLPLEHLFFYFLLFVVQKPKLYTVFQLWLCNNLYEDTYNANSFLHNSFLKNS